MFAEKLKIGQVKKGLFLALVFLALFCLYTKTAYHFPSNSDEANLPLQSIDIKDGNIFLRGWAFPPDHFYTIDILFDLTALSLGATPRQAMHIVPAVIYAAILMISCYLVYSMRMGARGNWFVGTLVTFISIAFPVQLMANFAASSPAGHLGTILFTLIAIAFLFQAMQKRGVSIIFFCFFTILANIGDPLSFYILNLPLMLLGAFILIINTDGANRNFSKKIIVISLVSALGAEVFNHIYFRVASASAIPLFVELKDLGHNFYLYIASIFEIFGASFFGNHPASFSAIAELTHFAVLLFSIFIAFVVAKNLSKNINSPIAYVHYLEFYLISSVIFISFAFLFSNLPVDLWTSRYLLSIPIFLGILAGIYVSQHYISKNSLFRTMLFMILSIYMVDFFVLEQNLRKSSQPLDPVIQYLKSHNLREGFATYWSGSITTVLSNGQIQSRAVLYTGKQLSPFHWVSKSSWYRSTHAVFFILDQSSKNFGVDPDVVIKEFGTPAKQKKIGDYTIFIWNHEISLHGE